MLLQQQIINYSGLEIAALENVLACTIEVSLTYEQKRQRVENLLLEVAGKTREIIQEPPPMVLLKRLIVMLQFMSSEPIQISQMSFSKFNQSLGKIPMIYSKCKR
jgi:small-conductance mechanosensitive channel